MGTNMADFSFNVARHKLRIKASIIVVLTLYPRQTQALSTVDLIGLRRCQALQASARSTGQPQGAICTNLGIGIDQIWGSNDPNGGDIRNCFGDDSVFGQVTFDG